VVVRATGISGRNAAPPVLAGLTRRLPRLRHLWVVAGDAGKGAERV
jgi:hypothetical protein